MNAVTTNDILQFLTTLATDNVLNMSLPLGEGYIKSANPDDDISVFAWYCFFSEQTIIPLDNANTGSDSFFYLVYYLSPETFNLEKIAAPVAKINSLWNTVFITDTTGTQISIRPAQETRCLQIRFTKKWLEAELSLAEPEIRASIEKKLAAANSFSLFEIYGTEEKTMIEDIYQNISGYHSSPFYLKSRVITTINDFLLKIANRKSSAMPVQSHTYEREMKEIAVALTSAIKEGLPPVKELARKFYISESTLKRSFKKIYGKTITDYFLQKKMDHAFGLIKEKQNTVSETASILGYENVSRFITIFKKYNGCSPGSLLR